jgi:hypothetical protein
MKAIKHHIHGTLFQANGRSAILLLDANPAQPTADSLYLRYVLVTLGPEEHIFPAFVLDDWGTERNTLELYAWVEDEGNRFPRAELFGFDPDGSETQAFLRALELYTRLPVYVYPAKGTPLAEGVLLEAILLPTEGATAVTPIPRPTHLERPLCNARVRWYQASPHLAELDWADLSRS